MPAVLDVVVRKLMGIDGIGDYIPQMGSNLVCTRAGPIACGVVAYGASSHLASVVIEAQRLDGEIRAGLNIKVDDDVARRLRARTCTLSLFDVDIHNFSELDRPVFRARNISKRFTMRAGHGK